MTFYTLKYIENNQSSGRIMLYSLMTIAIVAMIIFLILYMRNRLSSRYRDLGIIALLFFIMFSGVQYERFQVDNVNRTKNTQIIYFMKSVAIDKKVSVNKVLVNSTTLVDGVIVRINGNNFQTQLNTDNNSYTLTKVHVINKKVIVKR